MNQNPGPDEQFVRLITEHQNRLYGLILSMLPDPEQARDVLQETNVVIWKKWATFTPGTNFGAWSARIAFLQVMAHRTTQSRDRHIFDDELISVLNDESIRDAAPGDDRALALDACLERLQEADRELLRQRYSKGNTVSDLASMVHKTPNATRVALFRLRHLLLECIQGKLART